MSVIGVRASSKEIRYAILENDSESDVIFLNKFNENCITYPAAISAVEEKVEWAKNEMDRIFRNNPEIQHVFIKINEYRIDSRNNREASYIVAAFLLSAREQHIPVDIKINSQIASKAAKAMEYAENYVGKTDRFWNKTIADAILVAYWGLKNDV